MGKLGMMAENGRRLTPVAARRLVLIVAAGALLSACESGRDEYAPEPALSVEERYPIDISEKRVLLEVPVSPSSYRLTSAQRSEVSGFLRSYRSGGSGPLLIRAPSGTRNEAAALSAIEEIRELVAAHNIAGGAVSFSAYSGRDYGSPYPPVLLGYTGLKATSQECGNWSVNLTANYENRIYPNFGCSSQKNLAAMIDNPRDLETPRGMDPASAERRQTVRDKYIAGEPTAAKVDDEDKGSISEVGK